MLLGHTLEDFRTYVSIEQSSKFITISFINLCMYHLGRKEIKIGIFLRLPIHVYQCLDPWVIFLKESSELIQPPTSNCTQKEERETWCPNPLPGCAMDRRPLHYRQPLRTPWCSAWHQLSAAFLRASEAKWPPCSSLEQNLLLAWGEITQGAIPTAEGGIRWAGQRSLSYLPRKKGAQPSSKQTQALRNTPQ